MNPCKHCFNEEASSIFRCVIGDQINDIYLCEDCMKKVIGNGSPLGMIGEDIIFENIENDHGFSTEKISNKSDLECSCCHTTLNEIQNKGKFGCENCYIIYSDLLAMADAQINHDNDKLKKQLCGNNNEIVNHGRAEVLKQKMNSAIHVENYEEAAKLRDEINELKETDQDEAGISE